MRVTAAQIDAQHYALDAITRLLDQPEHRRGLTQRQISDHTGLSIGTVNAECKRSECVLRQRSHNRTLWFNDWSMCEWSFRPPKIDRRTREFRKKKTLTAINPSPISRTNEVNGHQLNTSKI